MKKVAIGIVLLVVMGFAAKEFIASKKTIAAPEQAGFKFYYYPKLNMYYDATQINFVYSVDGGHTWQTKKPTKQDLPDKLSEKVTLYSPDPDAWIYNSQHRQQYKGAYTNYVQRREDTAQYVSEPVVKKEDSAKESRKKAIENEGQQKDKKEGSWFKRLKDKFKKGFKKEKEPVREDTL